MPTWSLAELAEDNFDKAVAFVKAWVTDSEASARSYLADDLQDPATHLLALDDQVVIGLVTMRWRSNYRGFRDRNIPLLHQLVVADFVRNQGVGASLVQACSAKAREHGTTQLGTTVGLFDAYGPAQRLYVRQGFVPDGRGVCRGQEPVAFGATEIVDHDLILWLVKDLT